MVGIAELADFRVYGRARTLQLLMTSKDQWAHSMLLGRTPCCMHDLPSLVRDSTRVAVACFIRSNPDCSACTSDLSLQRRLYARAQCHTCPI